jgi:hypothetical protein
MQVNLLRTTYIQLHLNMDPQHKDQCWLYRQPHPPPPPTHPTHTQCTHWGRCTQSAGPSCAHAVAPEGWGCRWWVPGRSPLLQGLSPAPAARTGRAGCHLLHLALQQLLQLEQQRRQLEQQRRQLAQQRLRLAVGTQKKPGRRLEVSWAAGVELHTCLRHMVGGWVVACSSRVPQAPEP